MKRNFRTRLQLEGLEERLAMTADLFPLALAATIETTALYADEPPAGLEDPTEDPLDTNNSFVAMGTVTDVDYDLNTITIGNLNFNTGEVTGIQLEINNVVYEVQLVVATGNNEYVFVIPNDVDLSGVWLGDEALVIVGGTTPEDNTTPPTDEPGTGGGLVDPTEDPIGG